MSNQKIPHIIAHRGHSTKAPENTLSAFKYAIEANADFIELDIHLTKDLIPVVIHDIELDKTTNHDGNCLVSDFTLAELKQLDAGSWFSDHFKGEAIPTLLEVLNLSFGKIGLMIEIKTGSNNPDILAKRVLETISESQFVGNLSIGSFSSEILKEVRERAPHIPITAIIEFEHEINTHLLNNPNFFAIEYEMASVQHINTLRSHDKKIWVWTVDDSHKIEDLMTKQIDGIITNRPHFKDFQRNISLT